MIVSDNLSALNNEIIAVVGDGFDEDVLFALAETVSNLLVDALQSVLPSLEALGLFGEDALSLIGDLTGMDLNVAVTVAAPGKLDDSIIATVLVTIDLVDEPTSPTLACGGYTLVEDGLGRFTAPDFAGNLIVGTDGPETLTGTSGADLILGLGGDDDIFGSHGNDIICGGLGVDVINGENGNDILHGDEDADWLIGGNNNDTLYGGAGNDDLEGGNADDTIYGEQGNDVVFGGNNNDELFGGDGDDYLDGFNGNDLLDGGAGIDQLFGWNGNDTLTGGPGNDELDGGDGADSCDGGTGTNTLTNCEAAAALVSNLLYTLSRLQIYRINDASPADAIRGQFLYLYLPVIAGE